MREHTAQGLSYPARWLVNAHSFLGVGVGQVVEPVPAGICSPDYTIRAEPADIVAALNSLS